MNSFNKATNRNNDERCTSLDQSAMLRVTPSNIKRIMRSVVTFISNEVKERKKDGVVVGLSGGLDSAVSTILAVRALGNERVVAYILPEGKLTPRIDLTNAQKITKGLDIQAFKIDITPAKNDFLRFLPRHRLASGNLSSRIRMAILYYYATANNLLVLGTSDKSELMLGYFTKHGDGAADVFPLGGLYKTEVRRLASELGLPEALIRQPSSPRLWAKQTAEDEIGLPYDEIDEILRALENNSLKDCSANKTDVKKILTWINKTRHKREFPPVGETINQG
ncbi:MAG: NAD+ synthase [Thermoproteota archaeon]|nr:NAD+ synthase [Thermoproteota archaeon]